MWQIAVVANLAVALAYAAIVVAIIRPLVGERQLRSNRLGAAMAAIFFTAAVTHGSHAVRMLLPIIGVDRGQGMALRTAFSSWGLTIWDVVTAEIGIYYWSLRRTYAPLMRGAKLFEDLKERQRQALEINDNIVQGLFVAQTALALEEREMADEALRTTLDSARKIISELLGEPGVDAVQFHGLLRQEPALVAKANAE